jgi:hypothetical protein
LVTAVPVIAGAGRVTFSFTFQGTFPPPPSAAAAFCLGLKVQRHFIWRIPENITRISLEKGSVMA